MIIKLIALSPTGYLSIPMNNFDGFITVIGLIDYGIFSNKFFQIIQN
jgi:hypothetical protein